MIKRTPFLILAAYFAGCGIIGDNGSRSSELGQYDDLVPNCEFNSPTPDTDMICAYPPMLTSGSHAVDLRDCVKIEGGDLGDDVTLNVDGTSVTVDQWHNKDGEGEYVGFHADGDVVIVIKAGTDLYEASEGTWVHPEGTSGPGAKGISFVAFCQPPTDEPECYPANGSGGGDGSAHPDCGGGGTPGGGPGGGDGTPGDGSDGSDGGGGGYNFDGYGGGDGDDGNFDGDGPGVPYDGGDGGEFDGDGPGVPYGDTDDGAGSGGFAGGIGVVGDGGTSGGDTDGSAGGGTSGGDGGATSGGDGATSGGGTSGGGTGGGSGTSGTCAVSSCGSGGACPSNHACFSGCCLEVYL